MRLRTGHPFRLARLIVLVSVLAVSVGCVEIERTIRLNVDGSGQLVESIRFDDRLVQMAQSNDEYRGLIDFLEEKQVRNRLPLYGEVTLASHEIKDLGGRGKQATTVMEFKNINKLRLPVLPHRGANWTDQKVVFDLGATKEFKPSWLSPASIRKPLRIELSPATKPTASVDETPTPARRQELVRLLPAVRTMVEGFRITVRLEAFGPIYHEVGNKHVLYDISSSDFDDDVLINLIEWPTAPDKNLAWPRNAGATPHVSLGPGKKGRILAGNYTLQIAPPGSRPVGTTP